MTKKYFIQILCFIICLPAQSLVANLTTIQYWDPDPYFAACNNLMPSNKEMVEAKKAKQKDLRPDKSYHVALNFSGLIQAACRAKSCDGCGDYGTVCGDYGSKGTQMGDFRGTIYAMGLFLGDSPNGNSIWKNGINNGDIENITPDSINATQLPSCLKDIAKLLTGNVDATQQQPAPSGDTNPYPDLALMFNPQETTDVFPSVFSEGQLGTDTTFFGAFSLPLKYRKTAFRFELGCEFGDHVTLTIQGGVANIQQTTTGLVNISDCCPIVPGCTTVSDGTIIAGEPTESTDCLYSALNFRDSGGSVPLVPNSSAQLLYNREISYNAEEIFGPCGINQSLCNFDEYSAEDLRVILTLKNSYDIERYTRNADAGESWPDMIFTPYAWAGGSIPLAKDKDYSKLLSLPFGNNGHASLGGAVGMTFDFPQFVEIGFEGGVTHFFKKEECRPVPTHNLQRIIYPFWTKVDVEPGMNWHFKGLLSAYQFMHHISFWATYDLIEHRPDVYSICNNPTVYKTNPVTGKTFEETVFLPEQLSCCSDWRAQFINLAVVFDIQPGMQMSFLWQQPITPRNAYYPVSVLGTLTFLF